METLITPAELSQAIGVPEHTLAQWRYLGRGPAYARVGRFVRYRQAEIDRWLTEQTRGGPHVAA